MSIQVTVTDTETGESETATIENDYILTLAGTCWVSHIQTYPKTGTHVITVKGRK